MPHQFKIFLNQKMLVSLVHHVLQEKEEEFVSELEILLLLGKLQIWLHQLNQPRLHYLLKLRDLLKLESNYLPKDQISDVENKVLEILKSEQVVKVLYTPLINNLIDKNIKEYKNIDYIPERSFRNQLTDNIYIIEKKMLSYIRIDINDR